MNKRGPGDPFILAGEIIFPIAGVACVGIMPVLGLIFFALSGLLIFIHLRGARTERRTSAPRQPDRSPLLPGAPSEKEQEPVPLRRAGNEQCLNSQAIVLELRFWEVAHSHTSICSMRLDGNTLTFTREVKLHQPLSEPHTEADFGPHTECRVLTEGRAEQLRRSIASFPVLNAEREDQNRQSPFFGRVLLFLYKDSKTFFDLTDNVWDKAYSELFDQLQSCLAQQRETDKAILALHGRLVSALSARLSGLKQKEKSQRMEKERQRGSSLGSEYVPSGGNCSFYGQTGGDSATRVPACCPFTGVEQTALFKRMRAMYPDFSRDGQQRVDSDRLLIEKSFDAYNYHDESWTEYSQIVAERISPEEYARICDTNQSGCTVEKDPCGVKGYIKFTYVEFNDRQ